VRLISVEQDFAAAQTGRGAYLLEPERAERLHQHVRTTHWYVRSVETFELDGEGLQTLNLDWSMLGLSDVERSATSPEALNDFAGRIFEATRQQGLRVLFSVWVAPRVEFSARSS
jgi:hypothetical protein